MEKFNLNDRVRVIGKNVYGKIAFVGETHLSEGEWYGLILDEPKGQNNGSVDGQRYFKCPRNYGIFVRDCQLQKEDFVENKRDTLKVIYPNYLGFSTRTRSFAFGKKDSAEKNKKHFRTACSSSSESLSKSKVHCSKSVKNSDEYSNKNKVLRSIHHENHSDLKTSPIGGNAKENSADVVPASFNCFTNATLSRSRNVDVIRDTFERSISRNNSASSCICEEICSKSSKNKEIDFSQTDIYDSGVSTEDNQFDEDMKDPTGFETMNNCLLTSSESLFTGVSKTSNKSAIENKTGDDILLNTTTNDVKTLKEELKRVSHELLGMKKIKTEDEQKFKSLNKKYLKACSNLNEQEKNENRLEKELITANRQIITLKKQTRKSAKDLELYEMNMQAMVKELQNLREITEHVIIEKEIAEENNEQLQFRLKEEGEKMIQLEIEIEILKEEMQIQQFDGVPAVHCLKKLQKSNKVLSNALQQVKDLYKVLRENFFVVQKENGKKDEIIRGLKENKIELRDSVDKQKEEIGELCQIIDDIYYVDEMMFEVTDQSLKYEHELQTLHEELDLMEKQLEISEEISEALYDIKSICTDDIECLMEKVKLAKIDLEQKHALLLNKDEIIDKFRDLTKNLKLKNSQLTKDLDISLKQKKEAITEAESLKLKNHHLLKRTLNEIIKPEKLKIDVEILKEKIKYWSYFMPDTFFELNGGNLAIDVLLLVSKLSRKLSLLIFILKEQIIDRSDKPDPKNFPFLITGTKFLILALESKCVLTLRNFCEIHTHDFLSSVKYFEDLSQVEAKIDDYLSLLCNDEIDGKCSLEGFQVIVSKILEMFDNMLKNLLQPKSNFECCLIIIQAICKCITVFCNSIIGLQILNESKVIHILTATKLLEIITFLILNVCRNDDEDYAILQPDISESLKTNLICIQESLVGIGSIYFDLMNRVMAVNEAYFDQTESRFLDEIFNKVSKVQTELNEIYISLKNGDLLIKHFELSPILSTVKFLSQDKKLQEKENVLKLKQNIASCELEIIKLSREIQKAKTTNRKKIIEIDSKNPNAEISKVPESCTTKTEVIMSQSQKVLSKSLQVSLGTAEHTTTMELMAIKLQDMDSSMRYLVQKNFELRLIPIIAHKKHLKPLNVLFKSNYNSSDMQAIQKLQRKLSELKSKLTSILVPLVVDITGNSKVKGRKYKQYLLGRMFVQREVEEEIFNIMCDLRRLKYPGCIWFDGNPFSLEMKDE